MLGTLINSLKSIIDLLHRKQESKKLEVDTRLAERELAEKESVIHKATIEDVKRYDARVQAIEAAAGGKVDRWASRAGNPVVLIVLQLIALALLVALVVLVIRLL